jgi:hypothetical protein
MIIGGHTVLHSKDPDADRAFLRDVIGLPHVDAGGGWLIFGLPPAEVAVHPADRNDLHEFYLLCESVGPFVSRMQERGVECSEVMDLPWGRLTHIRMPGGGRLGVYEPRHARPKSGAVKKSRAGARPARRKTARASANRRKTRKTRRSPR